jgi:hypothetical protein
MARSVLMPDLLHQLDQAVAHDEIEPWKAALLKEWLQGGDTNAPDPSAEDLARLLTDPTILGRLRTSVEGPWDSLVAQARSILAHERVGAALEAVEPE